MHIDMGGRDLRCGPRMRLNRCKTCKTWAFFVPMDSAVLVNMSEYSHFYKYLELTVGPGTKSCSGMGHVPRAPLGSTEDLYARERRV